MDKLGAVIVWEWGPALIQYAQWWTIAPEMLTRSWEGHKDSGNTNKSLERNQHKWLQVVQTWEKQ